MWAHAAGAHEDIKAAVYDFCKSRAGANAKAFLDKLRGSHDFSACKQLMDAAAGQITVVGCWAQARRKFHVLHQGSQSQMAEQAIKPIAQIDQKVRSVGICLAKSMLSCSRRRTSMH